jgi:UTP:GlnB (protein PII) uridylyltransferase
MFSPILAGLDQQFSNHTLPLTAFKQAIKAANEQLADEFTQGTDVVTLVHARAQFVDALLQRVWQQHMPEDGN